jgi:hypothetical protein
VRIWIQASIGVLSGSLALGAQADEGGVSFWLPGQFGSFAAVPSEPGWTIPLVYVHTSAGMGGDLLTLRGRRLAVGVDATADILLALPTYVFETPVLGAQAALAFGMGVGHMKAEADATLSGPFANVFSASERDSRWGGSDLYGLGTLKWHQGVHNYMTYSMVGAPVGAYSPDRLANLGLNHWSIDAGGGYSYFDKENEFSAVLGFTYNFRNSDTDYKNGVDSHLDLAASHFFSKQTHAGPVGYIYRQVGGDSGSGATLGDYKSRVNGLGLQIGHFFPVNDKQWYVNVKSYKEFGAKNRAEGWNVWVSLAIPLGGETKR